MDTSTRLTWREPVTLPEDLPPGALAELMFGGRPKLKLSPEEWTVNLLRVHAALKPRLRYLDFVSPDKAAGQYRDHIQGEAKRLLNAAEWPSPVPHRALLVHHENVRSLSRSRSADNTGRLVRLFLASDGRWILSDAHLIGWRAWTGGILFDRLAQPHTFEEIDAGRLGELCVEFPEAPRWIIWKLASVYVSTIQARKQILRALIHETNELCDLLEWTDGRGRHQNLRPTWSLDVLSQFDLPSVGR